MKHLYIFGLMLAALLTVTGCNPRNKKNTDGEKPLITVTIEPLRYFTEAIAGERFKVVSMVPDGNNPENYDPTPQQLIDLSKSKAYFKIGYIGFERAWMERLTDNAPHLQIFDLSKDIDLIYGETHTHGKEEEEGESHRHYHGGVEPHVWTSFENAQIIAGNILKALCALDKEHRLEYKERFDHLFRLTVQLDTMACRAFAAPQAERAFMIYHPALSYFARDYGLHQIPIEEGGKEPSPAQLKALINLCREEGVKTIFVQPEFDVRNAELIARETGTDIERINPLSYHWPKEMAHIVQLLSNVPDEEQLLKLRIEN